MESKLLAGCFMTDITVNRQWMGAVGTVRFNKLELQLNPFF
jgi:hypothetical protein